MHFNLFRIFFKTWNKNISNLFRNEKIIKPQLYVKQYEPILDINQVMQNANFNPLHKLMHSLLHFRRNQVTIKSERNKCGKCGQIMA